MHLLRLSLLLLIPLAASQLVTVTVTDPTGGAYHVVPEPAAIGATNQFYISTSVASPASVWGFLQLTLTADTPLTLPIRNVSEPLSFGFVVANPRPNVINAKSRFGTVGSDAASLDPFLAPWLRSLSWATLYGGAWSAAVQTAREHGKLAYGMFAGNSTGGVSWDTLPDDNTAISQTQLDSIQAAARDIIVNTYANGQNSEAAEIDLGFEENLTPNWKGRFYFANLAQKALAVRRAATAAGAPNLKLNYQVVVWYGGGQVLNPVSFFLNSPAAAQFDNVAIHAYPWPAFPYADSWMPTLLKSIRSPMAALNQTKPIQIEIGVAVNDPPVSGFYHEGVILPGASQSYAASYMWRASVVAISLDVQRIMWREYQDTAESRYDAQANFGHPIEATNHLRHL